MKNGIILLLFLSFASSGSAQELGYEVFGTYNKPILKEKLKDAATISDINPGYPSSWISSYLSVEIMTNMNGVVMKAISLNDTLSNDQKNMLRSADIGTHITVDVKYNPKNGKKDNLDIKKINFTYTVAPEVEAEYVGGYDQLKSYLKETAIDKISEPEAKVLQQAVVKFTIDEEGKPTAAHISITSDDEKIDQLLLDVIRNMPNWKPAKNAKGIKIKQEFEFRVGNLVGC